MPPHPLFSLRRLSSPCVLLLITLSERERRRGGARRRRRGKKGTRQEHTGRSSQPVSTPVEKKERKRKKKNTPHTHNVQYVAINAWADNEPHSDDRMTRWRLGVIWIVRDRRQRQSAEQTPGLMRECLLCNTSQTQQHLFFYSGLSLPGSSDTEIPC